jgi:hypothetical protein
MKQALNIVLKLHCYHLPGKTVGERKAVRLGIQKRDEVIDDISADVDEAIFLAPLMVEFSPEGTAKFLGPYVHGNPREKFIYLCWGERAGSHWDGFSRAKLQLLPIPAALLFRAADTETPLEVRIDMQDEKGKIICATIKQTQLHWG